MIAILWDGYKQLHGYLEFGDNELIFRLEDFSETSLHLTIPYAEILKVSSYKVYGISSRGVEITSKDGKRNVFVVEDILTLKQELEKVYCRVIGKE